MSVHPYLSQKVGFFKESVIREMTRICHEVGGVNLAQGFPDHDPIPAIKEAAKTAIDEGYNQYAITWGEPSFREAIAKRVTAYNRIPTDPDQNVTVTCGATEAMICVLLSIINPGDEVIVFEPFYENYGPDCIISGAKPVYVALKPEGDGFVFDRNELKKAFSKKTKAIILNTPHNPLGKVFSREELSFIAELCQTYDVLAVTDEIYEYILYDDHEHVSIASLPNMLERTITIGGCSKTYSVTGWRLAYMIAPYAITKGLRKIHDFLTVGAPHPLQRAASFMLNQGDAFFLELKKSFNERRQLLFEILKASGFQCYMPQGAYYILTDVGHWYGKALRDDEAFCLWLAKEVGVAAVPGSSFYHAKELGQTQVRFTFSKKPETLQRAGDLLKNLTKKLPD